MDKTRILIIDDEVAFTRMVKLNLEKTGEYDVREETRAPNALASAREFKPDLILLDVIMPTMDGGDVHAQLQKDRHLKGIPILFLTATVSKNEAGPHGLTSGGATFLAKPITAENLVQRIREHLRKPAAAPPAQAPAPPPAPPPPRPAA